MKKIGILSLTQDHTHHISYTISPDYARMIESIGMLPVMIPYRTESMDDYIQQVDAFLIPGGKDVSPECYKESLDGAHNCSLEHDIIALDFIDRVKKTGKTLFGICRGMQLINVYFGGTLIQHLDSHEVHNQPLFPKKYIHSIKAIPLSFLYEAFQKEIISVNSIHHQAVKMLGDGLESVAFDEKEPIIEAIAHRDFPFFGVQWHPEKLDTHQVLFEKIFSNI